MRISTAFLIGAVIPPVVAILIWRYLLRLDSGFLLNAVAFRAYALLLVPALLFKTVTALRGRQTSSFLLYAGLLLILLQGTFWYCFRFTGLAAVGAGEQITEFYDAEPGVLVKPPRLPARVSEVVEAPQSVKIVLDGVEHALTEGGTLKLRGFRYRMVGVEHAPLLSVQTKQGGVVDEVYAKIAASQFIMLGRLPHRFYIRQIAGQVPPLYSLKVVRDKLTIVDKKVKSGEKSYFDGHYVSCSPGAPWAKISVEKVQSKWSLFAGLALVLAGGVMRLRTSRSKPE